MVSVSGSPETVWNNTREMPSTAFKTVVLGLGGSVGLYYGWVSITVFGTIYARVFSTSDVPAACHGCHLDPLRALNIQTLSSSGLFDWLLLNNCIFCD